MNYIKPTVYAIMIGILLYWLSPTFRDIVDSGKETWNYIVDYVLTFRYRQPTVFISLPIIAIWLLGMK